MLLSDLKTWHCVTSCCRPNSIYTVFKCQLKTFPSF